MIFAKVRVDGRFFGRIGNRQWRNLPEPQV
jgi:hypothetical protein